MTLRLTRLLFHSPGAHLHRRKDPTGTSVLQTALEERQLCRHDLGGQAVLGRGGNFQGPGVAVEGTLETMSIFLQPFLYQENKCSSCSLALLKDRSREMNTEPHRWSSQRQRVGLPTSLLSTLSLLLTKPQVFRAQAHSSRSDLTVLLPPIQQLIFLLNFFTYFFIFHKHPGQFSSRWPKTIFLC